MKNSPQSRGSAEILGLATVKFSKLSVHAFCHIDGNGDPGPLLVRNPRPWLKGRSLLLAYDWRSRLAL